MTTLPSFPTGARVGFAALEPRAPRAWEIAYQALTADIRCRMSDTFPSLDPIAGWRGGTERVLLRNVDVDVGISVGHGLAAIWMAVRDDRDFRLRSSWRDLRPVADAWLCRVAPRFDEALDRLGCSVQMPLQTLSLAA